MCNTWFVSIHTGITCSDQCQHAYTQLQKRQAKDRRRARKRDAFVENVYRKRVFERDGYRCYLCNKKLSPTHKQPDRRPQLEHVVPLARGGTHEPLNCRTACGPCNRYKGDRGGGEQLLLIA